MEYQNLSDLLKNDPDSKTYFDQLTNYVRRQISDRPDDVTTFNKLKNFAEIFTRDEG